MEVKYIDFEPAGKSASGKTKLWDVISHEEDVLGQVKYHPHWRRYAFYPEAHTLYEQDCLRKIADFIEEQSTKLRASWKRRKKK